VRVVVWHSKEPAVLCQQEAASICHQIIEPQGEGLHGRETRRSRPWPEMQTSGRVDHGAALGSRQQDTLV
jgi:hypothetical protein